MELGPVTNLPDCSLISISPSGRRTLIVPSAGGGASGKDLVVEVWAGARKLHDIVVPTTTHGPVFADGFFGYGFTWSACERYVVYAAQVSFLLCLSVLILRECNVHALQ